MVKLMRWDLLLNNSRRKKQTDKTDLSEMKDRTGIESDYDRILFSAPIRRLADKTQFLPCDTHDSVRTRLTHSHEVSNIARRIGTRLIYNHFEDLKFPASLDKDSLKRNIPCLLASIGLVHDIGNPPFGHKGEESIQNWFKNKFSDDNDKKILNDFIQLDGNAQTFRLVTRLQVLNDDFGLDLTYATLAAMIKYPVFWSHINHHDFGNYKKARIFESEKEIAKEVWKHTGLSEGRRHPLIFVMEACDDIAYTVIDAEDTIKKGLASFADLEVLVLNEIEHSDVLGQVADMFKRVNRKGLRHRNKRLNSSEINDVSMQYFRSYVMEYMIGDIVDIFIENIDAILETGCLPEQALFKMKPINELQEALHQFSVYYGYKHNSVLRLELEGANYISGLMDMLWKGICEGEGGAYGKYVFSRLSSNYVRIYAKEVKRHQGKQAGLYYKAQLLVDAISGMTERYLMSFHNDLKPLHDAYNSAT